MRRKNLRGYLRISRIKMMCAVSKDRILDFLGESGSDLVLFNITYQHNRSK